MEMLPRSLSLLLLLFAAAALLIVHTCIMLGGAMREAAVGFCAFALLIGMPIVALAWFGSVTDRSERNRISQRVLRQRRSDALLWQRTLQELQGGDVGQASGRVAATESAWPDSQPAPRPALATAQPAAAGFRGTKRNARRSISGLAAAAASTLGLMGCFPDPVFVEEPTPIETWAMVQPGMGTTQLVALMGAPNRIKSRGTTEIWQYCRDGWFGRNARYYMAVLIESDQVQELRPYQTVSDAGCEAYYRTGF